MSLFFMKNKYEIDNEILKKTTHCQNNFSCLEGYLPKICVYVPGIKNVICENMDTEFTVGSGQWLDQLALRNELPNNRLNQQRIDQFVVNLEPFRLKATIQSAFNLPYDRVVYLDGPSPGLR